MTPVRKTLLRKLKVFGREREKPSEKDVKESALSESTMNKYRERYKEEWKQTIRGSC